MEDYPGKEELDYESFMEEKGLNQMLRENFDGKDLEDLDQERQDYIQEQAKELFRKSQKTYFSDQVIKDAFQDILAVAKAPKGPIYQKKRGKDLPQGLFR